MATDKFYQAIASLGYINIDGFHMHRLLHNEILRLSLVTGSDLWNLILKVNDCDDLLEVNEIKHVS